MNASSTIGALRANRSQDKAHVLGHFAFAVISAVALLGGNAYPAEITRHLTKTLERHVALAQVFLALERLEDKGLVSSREVRPEPARGGRRRRIFQLEASGVRAIRNTAAVFDRAASTGQTPEVKLNGALGGATS